MTLPVFTDTALCRGGKACSTCRRKEGGRPFRELFRRFSALPDDDVDFECPRGKAWASEGLGDTIAKVTTAFGIKPCGGCKERQAKLNKLMPYKG